MGSYRACVPCTKQGCILLLGLGLTGLLHCTSDTEVGKEGPKEVAHRPLSRDRLESLWCRSAYVCV